MAEGKVQCRVEQLNECMDAKVVTSYATVIITHSPRSAHARAALLDKGILSSSCLLIGENLRQ